MKILISCNNISSYGGGEIYNYELIKLMKFYNKINIFYILYFLLLFFIKKLKWEVSQFL